MPGFSKLLIANRGEIAVRVIRTATELGYRTVAVYSDADAHALHVELADEAVRIGPASVSESYLHADALLDAARRSGADAIHPGYGFLSENAEFARACERAGIVFIGPGADAIELMGSKRLSKAAMLAAGVPCIPGYQGAAQDDDLLANEAKKLGFPLMVKASAGGGGRGMRLVKSAGELSQHLSSARSEAQHAFGNNELILERALIEPRHIEIQIFADRTGNVVHLGERDCSVQRRHQKVVEEAPSPFVDAPLRQKMGAAAIAVARSCDYVGAGTVEFLVDRSGEFYFLEMNTRLQVEHPVTEMVTDTDLVAWQLRIAAGESLPLRQEDIALQGHAIEVRLYADDPRNDFLPQTGTVQVWDYPRRTGIRVDHGIKAGQVISPHYDPLLAKIIAHGADRDIAIRRLATAVADTVLLGVNHNKLFLHNVLTHERFRLGDATTAFIDQHLSDDASRRAGTENLRTLKIAALLYYLRAQRNSPRQSAPRWQSASLHYSHYRLQLGDLISGLKVRAQDGLYQIVAEAQPTTLTVVSCDAAAAGHCIVQDETGHQLQIDFAFDSDLLYLDDGSGHYGVSDVSARPARVAASAGSGDVNAAMDGTIIEVSVKEGDHVAAGQTIVVLEAMKMEHQLKSGIDGIVESVRTRVTEQVRAQQLLVRIVAPGMDAKAGCE